MARRACRTPAGQAFRGSPLPEQSHRVPVQDDPSGAPERAAKSRSRAPASPAHRARPAHTLPPPQQQSGIAQGAAGFFYVRFLVGMHNYTQRFQNLSSVEKVLHGGFEVLKFTPLLAIRQYKHRSKLVLLTSSSQVLIPRQCPCVRTSLLHHPVTLLTWVDFGALAALPSSCVAPYRWSLMRLSQRLCASADKEAFIRPLPLAWDACPFVARWWNYASASLCSLRLVGLLPCSAAQWLQMYRAVLPTRVTCCHAMSRGLMVNRAL